MKSLHLLFLFASVTAFAQHPELESIDPKKIEGHMHFLSDDLLKGRAVGSEGFEIASSYVKSQFISMGLKPAAEGDSYVQPVIFKQAVTNASKSFLHINGKPLVMNEDYIVSPYFESEVSDIEADLVFVGFGISAPEFGYDDYAGMDVKGKIVVYINDAPASFPGNEKAYYTTAGAKYEAALAKGAVGVIAFMHPANNRRPWAGTVGRSREGRLLWTDKAGNTPASFPALKAVVNYNSERLPNLFGNNYSRFSEALASLNTSKPASFNMNSRARIHGESTYKTLMSHNLLAEMEGSDPALKNEYLVYAAHLDHLGTGRVVNGDSIYNGAHDNASGVAILLEIARTFSQLKEAPKRSILFAVVTGEESGLLGSDYLATFPPAGKEKMIANISMDMPFFFHPVLDIVPYGAAHSSLGQKTQEVADFLGLGVGPDPFPEQVIFIRSDHFSFVKKGIPALFIKSGFKSTPDDTRDHSILDVKWRTTHYHQPQDDMNQPFYFPGAAMHVKVNYLIGKLVANDPKIPTWNAGDFFGLKMGKK